MKNNGRVAKALLLVLMVAAFPVTASAQFGFGFGGGQRVNRDSLNKATLADYNNMLQQLGIGQPREGRQPNSPDQTKHPNYNELTANPYPVYPDPLVTFSGKEVKNAKMWNKVRRPEIVKSFEENVYGRIPENTPQVTWTVTSEQKAELGGIPVVIRNLNGRVDNSACPSIEVNIQAQIIWPEGKINLPVVMEFGFISGGLPRAYGNSTPWQQQVVERGWAAASVNPGSIQADAGYGLTSGIIGLCNKGEYRKPTDWGALRAWGWGAGKVLDYFETCPEFDAGKVAIEGVSRYGKAALVTMAFDERFLSAFVASSGKSGAAGWRRDCGESIGNIVSNEEYHWVCGNLIKYGTDPMTENDLPVDQHELIALCAPRPCFISAGTFEGDKWQDVTGSFYSAAMASPVYELLGKQGVGTYMFPGVDNGLTDGDLAYRQHHGGHEAGPNWPYFLDFFARYVK